MMSSLPYILGLLFGLLAGFYYFYGLLYTVRIMPGNSNPKRLLALSYLLRICPVLLLMVLIARKDPGMFITLLVGFFMVRVIMTRMINRLTKENVHAPQP